MCLIVYSPTGVLVERTIFDHAHLINPDGLGVMSRHGVQKFVGKTARRRAWRYLRQLAASRVPHGIHFRFATHGGVTRENCHPFYASNSDAIVMHNGVIGLTAVAATSLRSDTSLFVEEYMSGAPGPEDSSYERYYRCIGRTIGSWNTLLVFHALTETFTICNEPWGEWIGDHWYSNLYSLPWNVEAGMAGMTYPDSHGEWGDEVVYDELDDWPMSYPRFGDERYREES
jgi:hypothetical protein